MPFGVRERVRAGHARARARGLVRDARAQLRALSARGSRAAFFGGLECVACVVQQFVEIIRCFHAKDGGVPRRVHRTLLASHRFCFSGSEAVDWIVSYVQRTMNITLLRADALRIGVRMQERWVFARRGASAARLTDDRSVLFQLQPLVMLSGHAIPFEDVRSVTVRMSSSRGGVAVQDRTYMLRNYAACFVGSQACDWLVGHLRCTRKEAIRFGRLMVEYGQIHHVTHQHRFADAELFYRFSPSRADLMRGVLSMLNYMPVYNAMRHEAAGVLASAAPVTPEGGLGEDAVDSGFFSGRAAVAWLMEFQRMPRRKACQLCTWLCQANLIQTTVPGSVWRDDDATLYRFAPSEADPAMLGDLCDRMRAACGALDASGKPVPGEPLALSGAEMVTWIALDQSCSREAAVRLGHWLVHLGLILPRTPHGQRFADSERLAFGFRPVSTPVTVASGSREGGEREVIDSALASPASSEAGDHDTDDIGPAELASAQEAASAERVAFTAQRRTGSDITRGAGEMIFFAPLSPTVEHAPTLSAQLIRVQDTALAARKPCEGNVYITNDDLR